MTIGKDDGGLLGESTTMGGDDGGLLGGSTTIGEDDGGLLGGSTAMGDVGIAVGVDGRAVSTGTAIILGLGIADSTIGTESTLVGKGVRLEAGVKAKGGSFPAHY